MHSTTSIRPLGRVRRFEPCVRATSMTSCDPDFTKSSVRLILLAPDLVDEVFDLFPHIGRVDGFHAASLRLKAVAGCLANFNKRLYALLGSNERKRNLDRVINYWAVIARRWLRLSGRHFQE